MKLVTLRLFSHLGMRRAFQLTLGASVAASFTVTAESLADRRVEREGVAVELKLTSAQKAASGRNELVEGADAAVRFHIRDAASGAPLTGLRPSAWVDLQRPGQTAGTEACQRKVQSFLQGSMRTRPSVDLNSYHVLALNQESNLSVIDPLTGFGSSKLLALVMLNSPGEDWVLLPDRSKLFVSMPLANQIAVIDTNTWKVIANIDAGYRPGQLVLQPDRKYLWAANGDGAVTAIDTGSLTVAARIKTGAGPHQVVVTPDDRHVFVTNRAAATVSVIDVGRLTKIKDIPTGRSPTALTVSPLANAVFIGHQDDAAIVAIDTRSLQVTGRIAAKPGVHAIRFVPQGRLGLAVNRTHNLVHVIDPATNRVVQDIPVGEAPEQISFTESFAYVHSANTAQVSTIRLSTLDKQPDVGGFQGGQIAPGRSSGAAAASTIVPAPEGGAVYVANPSDQALYYYTEGMAAPKGALRNYRREPRAVLVVDKSLREVEPGVYAANLQFPSSGSYDVALLLDTPRLLHCFTATAVPDPALAARKNGPTKLEYLVERRDTLVNQPIKVRFKLTDAATSRPREGGPDVRVLSFLAPGTSQSRSAATPLGDGLYEVSLVLPRAGLYYVFVEAPSLQVRYNQFAPLTLQVLDQAVARGASNAPVHE